VPGNRETDRKLSEEPWRHQGWPVPPADRPDPDQERQFVHRPGTFEIVGRFPALEHGHRRGDAQKRAASSRHSPRSRSGGCHDQSSPALATTPSRLPPQWVESWKSYNWLSRELSDFEPVASPSFGNLFNVAAIFNYVHKLF
jgi:hypothetical protein